MQNESPTPSMVVLRPCLPPHCSANEAKRTAILFETARAVTSSAIWRELGPAAFVVRPDPTPLFGIAGYFDEAARARLGTLQWQLERVLPHLVRFDYAAAEDAAGRLAQQLLSRFGRTAVDTFFFTAIPRGGHIVLGMLSYLLDIRQEMISPRSAEEGSERGTLVVVDDCALTGNRFRRFLASCPTGQRVVFAPLFSAPELRANIEEDERVVACLSAHDLRDLAPDREGDDYEPWRERWRERHGGRSYWIGQPVPICFPWSEPDFGFWNPVTEREEKGWNLVPPERCLEHRAHAGTTEIQMQPAGAGSLRPAGNVLFASYEDRIVIASPSWNSSLSLEGVAARMWTALLHCASEEDAAEEVAQAYGTDVSRVRHDLDAFVERLLERGALARCQA